MFNSGCSMRSSIIYDIEVVTSMENICFHMHTKLLKDVAILIPAFNPDNRLLMLLNELIQGIAAVIQSIRILVTHGLQKRES